MSQYDIYAAYRDMKRLCEESQGECRKALSLCRDFQDGCQQALNLCEESQALCKRAQDLCRMVIKQRDDLAEQCAFYEQVFVRYEALFQEHGIPFESVFDSDDEEDISFLEELYKEVPPEPIDDARF